MYFSLAICNEVLLSGVQKMHTSNLENKRKNENKRKKR